MTNFYAMRFAATTLILMLVESICSVPAHAAAATGTPLPDPKAPIVKLAGIFRKATGLSFSSSLTYTSQSPVTGKPVVKLLDVSGELSKPSMFSYRTPQGGTIVSDSTSTVVEDSSLSHYSRFPAAPGFVLGREWEFASDHVMKGTSALLNYSMVGYLFAHITDRDFLQPQSMTVTGTTDTIDGKPVQDVEYKDSVADAHLYIDPTSGNLTSVDTTYSIDGGQTFEVKETITRLTLSPAALPVGDFLTTPPPGAVNVPIPAPTVAATKGSQNATRPAAKQKQWREIGGIWGYR